MKMSPIGTRVPLKKVYDRSPAPCEDMSSPDPTLDECRFRWLEEGRVRVMSGSGLTGLARGCARATVPESIRRREGNLSGGNSALGGFGREAETPNSRRLETPMSRQEPHSV